ncbi:hypothetical protein [Anaerorhabdus sp.]|uniref:hypothetical protein n=1 Tax=Anaerorhabdus sp. TaxID=1872524 RepID=UPI002FC6ADFE
MGYDGLLNVGSIVLGLIAIFCPLFILINRSRMKKESIQILINVSLLATLFSIVFVQLSTNYEVNSNDWSALMDTSNAITTICVLLTVVVVFLNILVYSSTKKAK